MGQCECTGRVRAARTSFFADDIVFEDCDEGDERHDNLFKSIQRSTGVRRTSAVMSYTVTRCARRASEPVRTTRSYSSLSPTSAERVFQRRDAADVCSPEDGPVWCPGNGLGFQLRGPDFFKSSKKIASDGNLYECVHLDMLTSDRKLENLLEKGLVDLPMPSVGQAADKGAGSLAWCVGCPLPRVIVVNAQLPYGPDSTARSSGSGSSVVSVFQIKPETLRTLQAAGAQHNAGLRNFIKFCEAPMGSPGNSDEPARSLNARRDSKKYAKDDSGLFKAIALSENWDDLGMPSRLKSFNGKPALITKSGTIVRAKSGEWMEVSVDLRQFAWLARSSLWHFRDLLPRATLHIGFLIQGSDAESLPEGLIGDVHMRFADMMTHPRFVSDTS